MIKNILFFIPTLIVLTGMFLPVVINFSDGGLTVVSPQVLAQGPPNCSGTGPGAGNGGVALQNPLQMNDLVSVIVAIADILLILAVPIIIIFIVYAGFLYVTAQGNSSKIQDAHRALLYALIGGAIILGAKVISAIVATTVNSITVP